MLVYLLKSGVCLAVFYGFYKFLLEKESIHTFKRYYLLASVVLAFIIPFITFTEYIKATPQNVPSFYLDVPLTNTIIEVEPINYASIILWTIYGLGVLLFSIKFFKNLSQLLYKIKHNTKVKVNQITNVLLQDLIVPHTFFNYIFLNKQKFETQQIPKEVLLHEETHAQQKHSLDVLFIEILQILFWFNPFIYFIKRSIKLNHEFLADQAVINNGVIPSTYQQILLAFSSNASEPPLANAINYSSIKKRFTVMKTHTSKQAFWLRSFILLPLLAILIYSFSEKQVIEKPFVVQQNKTTNGVTETMMKEYRDFINDFESSNRIIYPKYLRAVAIYDLMTGEQRNSVKKYPENIVSNLSNVKPKTPTEAEFNSWKDANKFAIWIDGSHVKNSELNNYKASDIKYFANSFVHNNARSEKFPQPYQNHLYTEKGFEKTFINSEKDNSILNQIKKELKQDKASNEIKVHISKDKKVTIGNETIDFNSLSEKLMDLTKNEKTKPLVYIEVEGHLSMEYLNEIKNEMGATNLKISTIRVNSMFIDQTVYKKEAKDYFKGIPFTGDTLAFKNEKNELVFGISSPNKLSSKEVDIIRKSFTEKYNIKQNTSKEPYIITGIKEPSNPNPFSLTMTDEDTTSTQYIKSSEEYDIITLKVPRNKNHSMSSSDIKSLQEYAEEIYSIENNPSKE